MIFSEKNIITINNKFENILSMLDINKTEELKECVYKLDEILGQEAVLSFKWICVYSPLSDIANYPVDLFYNTVKHSIYILNNCAFCKNLQEDIFLNYVLHPRVNNEELSDCRDIFYKSLFPRIKNLDIESAIIETNYFNSENVSYKLTDERTLSALSVFYSGFGRCGEESTFGVNVYRAIGIPARQVYAPRWSHCDDNHAWIEVFYNDNWHYLGACEPFEKLNYGWFTLASSRTMLIHSRYFGNIENIYQNTNDIISSWGAVSYINNISNYSNNLKSLKIIVKDTKNKPISNAKVDFQILNYSHFITCATIYTNPDGIAILNCGIGSINIFISKKEDNFSCYEILINTQKTSVLEITLENKAFNDAKLPSTLTSFNKWQFFKFIPPKEHRKIKKYHKFCAENNDMYSTVIHSGENVDLCNTLIYSKEIENYKVLKSKQLYAKKMRNLDENVVSLSNKYISDKYLYDILLKSYSNINILISFLDDEKYNLNMKKGLLLSLEEKDYLDVSLELLTETLDFAPTYTKYDDFYFKYILCPRVTNEPLVPYRKFIIKFFSKATKEEFISNPLAIWEYITNNIVSCESIEYHELYTNSSSALKIKTASLNSKKILFVNICRTLGIPARINAITDEIEYFHNNAFITVNVLKHLTCSVILNKKPFDTFKYFDDFSISILDDNRYKALNFSDCNFNWNNSSQEIFLSDGIYKLITTNRLPNGTIYTQQYNFKLKNNQHKIINLKKSTLNYKELLINTQIDDFSIMDSTSNILNISTLTNTPSIVFWLDIGEEPTEHLLNELVNLHNDFNSLNINLIFIVNSLQDLQNPLLLKLKKTLTNLSIFSGDKKNLDTITRKVYAPNSNLPFSIIFNKMLNIIFYTNGYNVGAPKTLIEICKNIQ